MLRPVFTKQLADTLLAGTSVNLFSPHGRGRRRTLEDLKTRLADDVEVYQIDLKRQQDMWQTWFDEVLMRRGQVVVIIHNIEYITLKQTDNIFAFKKKLTPNKITLLYVSEQPLYDNAMQSIELPVSDSSPLI